MRAIKIDAVNQSIKEVDVSGLEDWYREIGCKLVTIAFYNEKDEALLVDDEGLLKPQMFFFSHADYPFQPFAGNGLLIGKSDDEGETTPCESTVDELKAKIKFLNIFQVRAMFELC